MIVLSTKEKGNAICQGAKISVVAGENVQSAESIYIVGGVISIFIAAEKKKDKNIMTKIHNAFSSEEWKKGFIKEFCNDHNGPVRFLRSVFYDEQDGAEQIIDFFAAELEKKEKEVNEIIDVLFAPKKKKQVTPMNNTTNSWEEELATLTSVMLGGGQFKELSPLKDFIRTLLHDTEIAAREDEATNCAHFLPSWKEKQAAIEQGRTQAIQDAIEIVNKWGSAYPLDIFSDPWEGWEKDIQEIAKAHNKNIDNISAYYGRWQEKIWKEQFTKALSSLTKE